MLWYFSASTSDAVNHLLSALSLMERTRSVALRDILVLADGFCVLMAKLTFSRSFFLFLRKPGHSFEILKHLLEGDLEKEELAKALTPTMEEPTSDKLLEKLLENEETLKAADVAKALVKKALEEEATAAAEKKAAEEAAAAATGADVPAESEPAAVDDSGAAA